jgi:hypothetical protein
MKLKEILNEIKTTNSSDTINEDFKTGILAATTALSLLGNPIQAKTTNGEDPKNKIEMSSKSVYGFKNGTNKIINAIKTELNLLKPIKDISDKDISNAIKKASEFEKSDLDSLAKKYNITEDDIHVFNIDFNIAQKDMPFSYDSTLSNLNISKVINLIKFLKTKQNSVVSSTSNSDTLRMPSYSLKDISREVYPNKRDI